MTGNVVKERKLYFLEPTRFSFKYAPGPCFLAAVVLLMLGIAPVLQIRFTTQFIDLALKTAGTGSIPAEIYRSLTLVVLTASSWPLFIAFLELIQERALLQIRQGCKGTLIEKCARLDFKYIEDADSWDLISRIVTEPERNIFDGYRALLDFLSLLVRVIGTLAFLASAVWWSAVVMVLFFIPLVYISIRSGRASYNVTREVSRLERNYDYIREILIDREYTDERTLFGFGNAMNTRFRNEYVKANSKKMMNSILWQFKTKVGGLLNIAAGLAVILALLGPTISGIVSVGLFIAIINAVFGMNYEMMWGVSRNVDCLFKTGEYMRDVGKFMRLDEVPGVLSTPAPAPAVESIEFDHVSFRYPGTEHYVLENLSMKLDGGKHYAFVGANGAGKTTAIKLLTGLYRDYDGEIRVNGKNLLYYDDAVRKGMFAVVFQDFARYSFSVRENCAVGDAANMNSPKLDSRIAEALSMTELDSAVSGLPDGVDTLLGKIHESGLDMSGGQWQRLALSRAIVSVAPVNILDEPTAALDPISESRIYELFGKISKKKMTLFISHRLGSTKIADEIFVFSHGTIVEKGDFNALMSAKGLYCEMFEQQRSWYQ